MAFWFLTVKTEDWGPTVSAPMDHPPWAQASDRVRGDRGWEEVPTPIFLEALYTSSVPLFLKKITLSHILSVSTINFPEQESSLNVSPMSPRTVLKPLFIELRCLIFFSNSTSFVTNLSRAGTQTKVFLPSAVDTNGTTLSWVKQT